MPRRLPAYACLAAGLTALGLAQVVGEDRGWPSAVVVAVGCASVAAGARRPGVVAVAAGLSAAGQVWLRPGDPVFATFIALMVAAFALGRRGTRRELLLGGLAAVAGVGAVAVSSDDFVPVQLVFPVVYFALAFGLGRLVRSRERDAAAALAAAAREAEGREALALAAERARIAREMHDVVAHSVSLMVVQAESAAAVAPTDPARSAAQMERVADSGRQALAELRRLLGVLRAGESPPGAAERAPQPSLTALDALVAPLRAAGHDVAVEVGSGLDAVPEGLQLTAYRVVQEALTNAVRHGHAGRIDVRVEHVGEALRIEVLDDGRQLVPTPEPGHGLIGMRERLRLYGGTLDAGPRPDGGWRVLAEVPAGTP